jgi:erythronate-4-phosphate dehydrogenase
MRIVADENIPYIREALEGTGDVRLMSGRAITPSVVKDAEALFVRSITTVDAGLLRDSPVRFVATATTGTDHIDMEWLRKQRIVFADAAGSNARSVVDYFFCVFFRWLVRTGRPLAGVSVGVVGCGRIGSVIAEIAEHIGVRVVRNDPPLKEEGRPGPWARLEDAAGCDVVTVHTPLTDGGAHPTRHLCDERFFSGFRGGLFVNASRGAVCDNSALKIALARRRFDAVLDVWENEPQPDPDLMRTVFIGTPHIAGYSYNGKLKGTLMVRDALFRFLGRDPAEARSIVLPRPERYQLSVGSKQDSIESLVDSVLSQVYDPQSDDRLFRPLAEVSSSERAEGFDLLRKNYPVRREFADYVLSAETPSSAADVLKILGFCEG